MLTAQTMRRFRIARDWSNAGFFETTRLTQLQDDVRAAILAGKLVAISGPVGSGKTMMINRLQDRLTEERTMIVARSLSVDKPRVALPSLITALFLDVSGDATMKAPTQPEKRERLLQELIRKARKPVALFVDEAHDLHGNTLNGLKRLMEIITAGGGRLSVVLVGQSQPEQAVIIGQLPHVRVAARFERDAEGDLADGDGAEMERGLILSHHPRCDPRMTLGPARSRAGRRLHQRLRGELHQAGFGAAGAMTDRNRPRRGRCRPPRDRPRSAPR